MRPGSAAQQPYDFRSAAPLLGILQLPTCEMGRAPTSAALVRSPGPTPDTALSSPPPHSGHTGELSRHHWKFNKEGFSEGRGSWKLVLQNLNPGRRSGCHASVKQIVQQGCRLSLPGQCCLPGARAPGCSGRKSRGRGEASSPGGVWTSLHPDLGAR